MLPDVHGRQPPSLVGRFEGPLPGGEPPRAEALREEIEINKQLSLWNISDEHRRVLGTLLSAAKPADRIVYDYALATLKGLLSEAGPELAEESATGSPG